MSPIKLQYDPNTCEGTFFIDNSGLEKFDVCQRAAEIYHCNGREANVEKPALKFGGITHKVLETRYKNFDQDVLSQFEKLINVATTEFEKWTPPEGDHRTYAMMVDVIKEYGARYPFESFEIEKINGVPAVEIPFACPFCTIPMNCQMRIWSADGTQTEEVYVSNIHVVIKGKIDLIIKRDGRRYLLDHKTTSMMGPTYFADFAISSQVYTYAWAHEQLVGEIPYGFIANALGVRKETKSGKKLEFQRHNTLIYKELVDEWILDTQHKVADFFECARRGYFPKQTKWCAGKYGMCEYHAICTLVPAMRSNALMSNLYKTVTWDPLKTEE